jgi:pre-mRNA-processing factor 40
MTSASENWTIHTANNGLNYYYNNENKKSTWEKPEVLKTEEEKMNQCDWQEFKTSDGKTFYYNAKI